VSDFFYGHEGDVTTVDSEAEWNALVLQQHAKKFRRLADVPATTPPPLLVDRLDPIGHTVLFGTGGVGKGVTACGWIRNLVNVEGRNVAILDYEGHPEEWSRRLRGLGADTDNIFIWEPLNKDFGKPRPLWDQAEEIREVFDALNISVAVVDSAVPAAYGADPLRPETAMLYARGVQVLGRPTLTLAHVTKGDSMAYPFGSVFWHNLARMTWSLQREEDGRLILQHRKRNNYDWKGRFDVDHIFLNDRLAEVVEAHRGREDFGW